MKFKNGPRTLEKEVLIAGTIWSIFEKAFDCYFTTPPVTAVSQLKIWSVALLGGGCGTLYVSIGKDEALIGFVVNHEAHGDIGSRISNFKGQVVDLLGSHDVETDDTIAAFEPIVDAGTRAANSRQPTDSSPLIDGAIKGGNP